ncbi:unnamed protein product [Lactuca virosa]|uniref:Uncharacterized protein n=1 Tax=Lactuca virosa TaxID=75947 RepID=A0AAU9P213_9ASTR|nr:unnamed protein product [Lactuca virosa]
MSPHSYSQDGAPVLYLTRRWTLKSSESNWTVPVEEPGLWIHDFTLYGFVLCIPLIKAVGSNGNYKAIAEVCEQLQIVENRLKVKSLLDDVPMRRSSVDSTSGFQDDPQERWHIEFQP